MATEVPLIPCINRNFPRVLDISESGLVAYGSRCSIYVFNFTTTIPHIVDQKIIPNAHRGKVMSLSFCKTNNELIASIGEDNFIRLWNLQTGTCLADLEVKESTRVVEWLYGSSTCVCYPGGTGFVSKWNYIKDNLVNIKTGSDSFINILSSNKMCPELLAASHIVGSISILNINNQALMYKLKSHVMEITSLCWSSVSPTMLLSTSLDHTARVWKMGEYNPIKTFSYPRSRRMEDKKYPLKYCGMFHPENPDVIICSNVRGLLGEVAFDEEGNTNFNPYDERNSDNNFKSVNIMLPFVTESNKTHLLMSDHLKISLWDATEKKLLSSFTYLSGIVYDLSASTINPYNLGIGTGDGCLRVWNLSDSSKVDMTTIILYSRIKVMSLAWHPTEEGIIAYGSDEGRIGVADIQRKKSLYAYETHHSNSVYAMQWAPCLKIKDSDQDFFLYSCGGNTIYIHELHKPKEKPVDFDELISYPPDLEHVEKTHCELSWKSDYTCLIVGSFRGFLDLFDNKFNFLTRVTMQMKVVESIKWHPEYTFSSSKKSDYSFWFAVAGNDDNIQLFDTSDIKSEESETVLCRPAKTLIGHKKKISSLCWSPHNDGYLASASRDGTVLVWNAISSTIIANYSWHKEIVYSVHWSYFDSDTIYSGGMDMCLRVWKISEQIKSAPEKCQVIKRKTKSIKNQESRKGGVIKREKEKTVENDTSKESCDVENNIHEDAKELEAPKIEEVSPKEDSSDCKMKLEVRESTKYKMIFSGFMIGSKEKKLGNVLKLTDLLSQPLDSSDPENMIMISDKVTDEESVHCGLFCDQLTALKMLKTKAKLEKKAGSNDKAILLQLMANDVESVLMDAAENKKLTDFLMAAAITVSRKFYNEMCKMYAVQLMEDKYYMKAAMYLMFCGELHNAVKSLLEKGRILEALALAKAQLPADDPFIQGALLKASNHFSTHHELEIEAECYLALKEPSEAAKTLYRIGDSSSIYVSAYICKKFNLEEEAETYGYLCMEKCLAEAAWPTFYKIIDLIDSLKVYRLLGLVHEMIYTQMKTLKKIDGFTCNLFGAAGSKLPVWKSRAFGYSDFSFLPFVHQALQSENIIPENKDSLEQIRNVLNSLIAKRHKYETSEEAHINVAIYISQVIVSSLLNDLDTMQKYLLKVFPTTYNLAFLPRVMFWLFLPFDIYWCSNKDAFISENKYLESESSSLPHLRAFYESLCDEFTSLNTSAVGDASISLAFSSDLNEAVEQVLNTLSIKNFKDSLILYFSACCITELRRLAKRGWKIRCYNKVNSDDLQTNEILPEDKNLSDVCNENNKELDVKSNGDYSENTGQNILPGALLPEKDPNIQNEVSNHLSAQAKDNLLVNNGASLAVVENNVSHFGIADAGEVKNAENDLLKNGDCEIKDDMLSSRNNDSENESEIFSSSKKIQNSALHVKFEDISSKENAVSHIINGKTEKNVSHVSHNMENNVKVLSTECAFKIEQMFSETDDDHLQCWSDVSLFYILTKSFSSVNCRDEYALFFYLQKYLHYLDTAIADTSRQKSVKLVLSNPKEFPPVVEDECLSGQNTVCSNLIEAEKDHQGNSVSGFSKNVETSDSDKQNDPSTLEKELKTKVGDVAEGDVTINSNENCDLTKEKNTKTLNEEPADQSILEKELKTEIGDVAEGDVTINSNENCDLTEEKNTKTLNEEPADHNNFVSHENVDVTQEQMALESLNLEHEKVSKLLKLLSSVEFSYPNPFDAVRALNELCCDIFRKNPCNFVKKKFHEFAHEINKWNAKFCVKNEIVKCDICKEIISV